LSVRVFKIGGIEINFHYSWFVIFALITWSLAVNYLPSQYPEQTTTFYWVVGVTSAASLFLSVLIHEVSHSIVARKGSVGVRRITLHFFGGVAEIEEEARTPEMEFKMAAAGPLSSLTLAVILMAIWRFALTSDLVLGIRATLRYASYINFMLAAFNMIPAFPMDGGRILRAFLWRRSSNLLSSTKTATQVSQAFSFLLIFLGVSDILLGSMFNGLWLLLIGLFIKRSSEANMNATLMSQALEGVKVGDLMTREVHTVEPGITIQRLVDEYFMRYKHGGFPIVSEGRFLGLVTDHDVRKVGRMRWSRVTVEDIMKTSEKLVTIRPDDTASDALFLMSKWEVGRLPVIKNDSLVGIITRSDVTRAIKMKLQFKF
jgi:Zn-dependent protease/CBS domain-containing protein